MRWSNCRFYPSSSKKKVPPDRRHLLGCGLLLRILALLIGNAAAGLAGGLAGSLALAAATVLGALAEVAGLDGLNMLHDRITSVNNDYI